MWLTYNSVYFLQNTTVRNVISIWLLDYSKNWVSVAMEMQLLGLQTLWYLSQTKSRKHTE